jgi:hypothetical protein
MSRPAIVSWRESAGALTEAQLVAIESALEHVADLEQLFAFRADRDALGELRRLAAFLRSRAGDIRAERGSLELELLERVLRCSECGHDAHAPGYCVMFADPDGPGTATCNCGA